MVLATRTCDAAATVEALAEVGRLDRTQDVSDTLIAYHREAAAKAPNAAHLRDLVADRPLDDAVAYVLDLALGRVGTA